MEVICVYLNLLLFLLFISSDQLSLLVVDWVEKRENFKHRDAHFGLVPVAANAHHVSVYESAEKKDFVELFPQDIPDDLPALR